jgi:hypothetical protein
MINIVRVVLIAVIAGCQTQPYSYPQSYDSQYYSASPSTKNALVKPLNLKELPDTIRTEHEDRVNRLARLSRQFGVQAPKFPYLLFAFAMKNVLSSISTRPTSVLNRAIYWM